MSGTALATSRTVLSFTIGLLAIFDNLAAGKGLRAVTHKNNRRRPASDRFGEFGTEQLKRVALEARLSYIINFAIRIGQRVMNPQVFLEVWTLRDCKLTAMVKNPACFGVLQYVADA